MTDQGGVATNEANAAQAGGALQPISGVLVEIVYDDGEDQKSARRITCKRVRSHGGRLYLDAVCHERRAFRTFRVDRVLEVLDLQTGEVLAGGAFVQAFRLDEVTQGAETWGLERSRRYDLLSGIKLLAFIARCDGEWHPLEADVISEFVRDWWDDWGYPGEPPIESIMAYARKLSPTPDDFFTVLRRVNHNRRSARLLLPSIAAVVDADGQIESEEHRWLLEVQAYLAELERLHLEDIMGAEADGLVTHRIS